MIWIGTSGWVYEHWRGIFYPDGLKQPGWLSFYADHFQTVEINRSYYRLPTRDQFAAWAADVAGHPGFTFAVKASRYITHMKKLRDPEEPIQRLADATAGLNNAAGPFLYQLPPRWRADVPRLAAFLDALPPGQQAAFEFRDESWLQPAVYDLLERHGKTLVIAISGGHASPRETPWIGPFRYVRVHGGAWGIGLAEDELRWWADRIGGDARSGITSYVYFNNDPGGHALWNAFRLRELLGELVVPPVRRA